MELVVPDEKLSLAIGRKGQNVRLAAQLTGWKLDIISETKNHERSRRAQESLGKIEGVDRQLADLLYKHGFHSAREVTEVDAESLAGMPSFDADRAEKVIASARKVAELEESEARTRIHSKKATSEELATLTPAQQKLLEIRGIGPTTIKSLAAAGYDRRKRSRQPMSSISRRRPPSERRRHGS